jgi:hypothetical protein
LRLGDGLGGGEHGADTLAVARHVIPEQELGVGRIGDAPPLGGDKLSPVLAVELLFLLSSSANSRSSRSTMRTVRW